MVPLARPGPTPRHRELAASISASVVTRGQGVLAHGSRGRDISRKRSKLNRVGDKGPRNWSCLTESLPGRADSAVEVESWGEPLGILTSGPRSDPKLTHPTPHYAPTSLQQCHVGPRPERQLLQHVAENWGLRVH